MPDQPFQTVRRAFFWERRVYINYTGDEYLRDFFENAPIGFHVFGPDQIIIDINATELNIIGYEREEVVGKKAWPDLIVPEQRPRFERHWKDINTNGLVTNLQYTVVRKNGERIPVLLNASARFSPEGRLLHTRGSIVDITKLKKLEEYLRESQLIMRKNLQSLEQSKDMMEKENTHLRESYSGSIKQRILPLVERIKRRDSTLKKRIVNILENYMADLTGTMLTKLYNPKFGLSDREIEICLLVESGLTTREISELLCTSVRTVDNHRNHIRKKLGISKQGVDLGLYLKSM